MVAPKNSEKGRGNELQVILQAQSVTYLLPQCSAAGGETGNGCSLWDVHWLFPVVLPSPAGCACAGEPLVCDWRKDWESLSHFLLEETVLGPGARITFGSCHKLMGPWMQEILPLGMWSPGECSVWGHGTPSPLGSGDYSSSTSSSSIAN